MHPLLFLGDRFQRLANQVHPDNLFRDHPAKGLCSQLLDEVRPYLRNARNQEQGTEFFRSFVTYTRWQISRECTD